MVLTLYRLPSGRFWHARAEGSFGPLRGELRAGLIIRRARGGPRVYRCVGDRYGVSIDVAIATGLVKLAG